jgi:hypothetical protein|tara:strand:- start:206 stop:607 length:402 start_codon:yes stop_codon:yes gene_type:complete
MATKPTAARGKTTRKGRIKKMFENLKQTAKGKKTLGMSPGAMGGRTKAKLTPRKPGKMPAPLKRITENMRRQKLKGMGPMVGAAKSTIKGAGMSGAAMSGQAMKLAKKLKTSGRLSVADIKRAKEMMKNRKGK